MTEEQSKFMDSMFKFKIGDIVRHKVSLEKEDGPYIASNSVRFLITERVLQQCCGGLQPQYRCRGALPHGVVDQQSSYLMFDYELEPSKPFTQSEKD